ncbi:protein FAM47E isoform X3 [Peromyscus maniculatus bairdii]|uniref:protein FAM47E isoform X3 n=1 Tax=Peromyscus maniculatus bairdii TaxID=230844 RepID=UPI003FD50E05
MNAPFYRENLTKSRSESLLSPLAHGRKSAHPVVLLEASVGANWAGPGRAGLCWSPSDLGSRAGTCHPRPGRGPAAGAGAMAERGQRLQPTTLALGLQQEHRNRGRLPQATPKKRQNGLPKGAALLSKLSQARKAFLEDVEDNVALHALALYPHLEEALPAELLLQVLEALDPERKLEDTWACRQDTRKLTKGPTKLEEKRPSQVCLPKKMPVSHSGQWLCEEKPSEANSLYKDSLLHDNIRRGVRDFCHWATALGSSPIDEEFILQQFDINYQTRRSCDALPAMRRNQDKLFLDGQPSLREQSGCWNEPLPSGRTSPRKPKQVKMRFGAWYLKTNLWKKRRADEPLVDPKVSHKAQDADFEKHPREQAELLTGLHGTTTFKDFILSRGYRMPRFLEKIYTEEKGKSEHIKTPKNLTERNPGRR